MLGQPGRRGGGPYDGLSMTVPCNRGWRMSVAGVAGHIGPALRREGPFLRRAGPMCPAFRGGVIGTVLLVADGLGFGCRGGRLCPPPPGCDNAKGADRVVRPYEWLPRSCIMQPTSAVIAAWVRARPEAPLRCWAMAGAVQPDAAGHIGPAAWLFLFIHRPARRGPSRRRRTRCRRR